MWDSVCCSAPMTEEIGPSHNGRGRATRTCSACEAEYSAEVERWTPAEIRRRVAVVLGRAVSL